MSRSVDDPKPPGQALQRLVDVVAAGSRVIGVHVLAGSFSNDSYREELEATDGTRSTICDLAHDVPYRGDYRR